MTLEPVFSKLPPTFESDYSAILRPALQYVCFANTALRPPAFLRVVANPYKSRPRLSQKRQEARRFLLCLGTILYRICYSISTICFADSLAWITPYMRRRARLVWASLGSLGKAQTKGVQTKGAQTKRTSEKSPFQIWAAHY